MTVEYFCPKCRQWTNDQTKNIQLIICPTCKIPCKPVTDEVE